MIILKSIVGKLTLFICIVAIITVSTLLIASEINDTTLAIEWNNMIAWFAKRT